MKRRARRARGLYALVLAAGQGCVAPRSPIPVSAVPPGESRNVGSNSADVQVEARAWPDLVFEERARGFVLPDSDLVTDVVIAREACVLVDVALPRGIVDADLEAYDDAGRPLAVDRAGDRFAALVLCADETLRVHVRAIAAEGAGEIRVRSAPVDPALRSLASLSPSARHDARSVAASESARFATRITRAFAERGFTVVEGPSESLATGAAVLLAVATRAGECIAVVVRVDSRAALAFRPNPPGAGPSVRDEGTGRDLVVESCGEHDGDATVRIDAERGASITWLVLRGDARRIGGRASLRFGRTADEP